MSSELALESGRFARVCAVQVISLELADIGRSGKACHKINGPPKVTLHKLH